MQLKTFFNNFLSIFVAHPVSMQSFDKSLVEIDIFEAFALIMLAALSFLSKIAKTEIHKLSKS